MSTFSNPIVKEEPIDEEVSSSSLVMNSQLKVKTEPWEEDEVFQLRRKVEELCKRLFLFEDFIQVEFSDCDEKLTAFSEKRDRLIGLGFGESASNICEGIRSEQSQELVDLLKIAKEQEHVRNSTATSSKSSTLAHHHPSTSKSSFNSGSTLGDTTEDWSGSKIAGGTGISPGEARGPPRHFKFPKFVKKYLRKCPLCHLVIRRRDLLEHLIVVHQDQPVQCSICSSLFDSKKDLRVHLRDDHQLMPRSAEYKNAYRPVLKALQAIKPRFSSWANPLFKKAKPPTKEEYWTYQKLRGKCIDKPEEDDSPWNSGESDDDHKVADIPVQPQESSSEYLEGNFSGSEDTETSGARRVPKYIAKCPFCHKVVHRNTLLEHLIIVHQNQPLQCNICSALFNSRKVLRAHLTDDHHLGPRSDKYKGAYRSARNIFRAIKPQYESWAKPLVEEAELPTLEEYLIYHRTWRKKGNKEEGDIPGSSDDDLDLDDPGIPARPQMSDWSASRYLKRKKQAKSKKGKKGKTLPLHIRKPFQCRYCARRYFTKEPMELHQLTCSRAAIQMVEQMM